MTRVLTCPPDELPPGVDAATREQAETVLASQDRLRMSFLALDQVVQCGLFGEVHYRW